MIDKDNSGTLEKLEIVRAVKEDKKVIDFLKTAAKKTRPLHPPRLAKALDALDTDKSGSSTSKSVPPGVFLCPRDSLFDRASATQGSRHQPRPREAPGESVDERGAPARRGAGRRRIHAEFLNAAREVFQMIDKDDSGTLDGR